MKAVLLEGANQFHAAEIQKPKICADDLLVKMERAAICGTDIRILEGKKTKDVRYPSVIGHEFCGTIAEIGKNVTGFSIGEKVAIANVIPCGNCMACRTGHENACLQRQAIGYQFDGGFEEYIRIPGICIAAGNVIKLPGHVSFTAGALIEPLACCIRGMINAGTKFNDVVLVVGAGPIGLMHIQLSKIAGARKILVSEPLASRRQKALEVGATHVFDPTSEDVAEIVKAETNGLGADVTILAIGIPSIVNDTIKLCKKNGTLCLFAGFAGAGTCTIEANLIHYNELHICGSSAYTRNDYHTAAQLVCDGKINLDAIATHEYHIDDFQTAYDLCKSGAGLKVMIKP